MGVQGILEDPKDYLRKDWRDKSFTGYFIGYSEEGEVGYRLYILDLQEVIVGVNITFNEVIPSYAEEYNELNKLSFEVATDETTVDAFRHLVGENYFDDDTLLEFVTTRVVEYKGLIVAYRAPVLDGRTGREEKSPIHVADVMRMRESNRPESWSGRSTTVDSHGDKSVDHKVVATAGASSDGVERNTAGKRVKFNMRGGTPVKEWKKV